MSEQFLIIFFANINNEKVKVFSTCVEFDEIDYEIENGLFIIPFLYPEFDITYIITPCFK